MGRRSKKILMSNKKFCHLHVHNQYSLLDGLGSEKEYAKRAKELGFRYLALTNHGNIDGLIKHQKACDAEGIVPLFGCEVYIVNNMSLQDKEEHRGHMTILVKNKTGWRELCRLLTASNLEGFYKRPRVDYRSFLGSDLSGFIVMTGCQASFLNIKHGEGFFWNLVDEIKENLYLEVMPHDSEDQINHNKRCRELSTKYNIPLVATNDCHYILPEDNKAQEVLLAIQTHAKWSDKDRWKFDIDGLHLRTKAEMIKAFKRQGILKEEEYRRAMRRTIEIAEKCKGFRIEKQQISLPKIERPKKYKKTNDTELLFLLCRKALRKMGDSWTKEYQTRLNYELKVIQEKKFERYFLIVWDLIRWCKKNDIMIGPGRGSVGGSIVAYLLKITCVDPIKYNLLFSRFINEDRIDFPDIDIDFEDRKRDQVRKYLEEKYGFNNVSGISTFLQMKGKATVRDVCRVFDIPIREADAFAKSIEYEGVEGSILAAIKNTPEGRSFKKAHPKETKLATRLEGTIRASGQHAAAVIISSESLKEGARGNLCRRGKDIIVSNWDMEDNEYMGLMKLDILGLSALSILSETKALIKENHGKDIFFNDFIERKNGIPVGDKNILRMLSKGNTVGVFQLSTPLSKDICRKLNVNCFEDIASVLAIARPGSLHSGMTDEFIKRKHRGTWKRKNKTYEEITKNTYGVLIYQEQVMEVFHKIAGLPYSVADSIRKIIGKKRDAKEFEPYKEQFATGCLKMKTFNLNEVEWFWEMLLECANYLFNRSHSIEYAMLAYWTAFCKHYYPTEFICASLTHGGDLKKEELIEEAKRLRLKIISPKIELSDALKWKAKNNKLYVPFIEVKGFGKVTALKCVQRRKASRSGFFDLFPERNILMNRKGGKKTKVDNILEEIKAFDKNKIPNGIDKYFSFRID